MSDSARQQLQVLRRQQILQHLPQYVQGCYSDHPATQFECTQRIRQVLAIQSAPIQEVIDSGVIPRLVQFLQIDEFSKLQFEAVSALTNIAAGTSQQTAVVIRYGAVPILIKLIQSKSDEIKEQAIWAISNIAVDSTECRDLTLNHGALTMLLPIFYTTKEFQTYLVAAYMEQEFLSKIKNYPYGINIIILQYYLCKEPEISLLRKATWTLSNLCRGKPCPDLKYVKLAIKALNIMIKCEDDEILQDTCWAFSFLSDAEQYVDVIIDSGCLYRLICLLDHENANICHAVLRTIGNIVTGTDQHTQSVINLGVLKKLSKLIKHNQSAIKREACWAISNITAGSAQQIEAVIDCNLIEPLIDVLKYEKYEIAKEALWAMTNATSGGSDKQIAFLVQKGVIQPLISQFFKQSMPHKIILVALTGIDNILEAGSKLSGNEFNEFAQIVEESGGIGYLKQLALNQAVSHKICDKAISIIKQYFNKECTSE